MAVRPRRRVSTLLAVTGLLIAAGTSCSQPSPRAAGADAPGAVHVLMIDGGGRREQNYQSHLLHVKELRELVLASGITPDRITIFSSDGSDPGDDLAVREQQDADDVWLLDGTRLDGRLRGAVTYANSTIDGVTLRPATREAIDAWFAQERRRLRRGDTLLLYVTDHGTKNPEDLRNNRIVLWGKDQTLDVVTLRRLLGKLDPGVRVVMLLSQCYSGAFAHLATPDRKGALPAGNVCGYFASTADRPAYGCYPENRGRANVGHSFHFIDFLRRTGSLPTAHQEVLVADATPDVPFRTSDQFYDDLLHRVAGDGDFVATVDEWLAVAWEHRERWEPEIRLLDRIGRAFGYFSPRSLGELETQAKELPDLSESLKQQSRAWKEALGSVNSAVLERLSTSDPSWTARLDEKAIAALDPAATHTLTTDLVAALRNNGQRDPAGLKRQKLLHQRSEVANQLSYRMEVRLGVVLRMRRLLTSIAGRTYLEAKGSAAEQSAAARLQECEQLTLAVPTTAQAALDAAAPFPAFDDDLRRAETTLPAWMGIQFKPLSKDDQDARRLPSGAATVVAVYPDSPARLAGLEAGDVILGPPGAPFTEPNQVREWVMLSSIDVPRRLEVARADERLEVTLTPKPFPRKWPSLPGPPKPGDVAPALHLSGYRGTVPVALNDGKPRLLFFWATWCGICKVAVPELLAFEQAKGVEVIAITDETARQLDPFFAQWTKPFPSVVATDQYRRDFVSYAVSGTPSFVLVDGHGVVTEAITGYKADKGLGFKGWKWSGAPPATP